MSRGLIIFYVVFAIAILCNFLLISAIERQKICPESGTVLTNNQLLHEGLSQAVANEVFGPNITSVEQLFELDSDCCFLRSRGKPQEGIIHMEEPYLGTIVAYIDIVDGGLPNKLVEQAIAVFDVPGKEIVGVKFSIQISRCGEYLGSSVSSFYGGLYN